MHRKKFVSEEFRYNSNLLSLAVGLFILHFSTLKEHYFDLFYPV